AAKRLTIFAEKMKFTEFFSGKGKPWNMASHFCFIFFPKENETRGRLKKGGKGIKLPSNARG
ncbi:MAG: hypothetical protein ACLTAN_10490, partial [Christensenellaceae bacterium]